MQYIIHKDFRSYQPNISPSTRVLLAQVVLAIVHTKDFKIYFYLYASALFIYSLLIWK